MCLLQSKSGSFGDLTDAPPADTDLLADMHQSAEWGGRKEPVFNDLKPAEARETEAHKEADDWICNEESPSKVVSFKVETKPFNFCSAREMRIMKAGKLKFSDDDSNEPIPYERSKIEQKKKGISSRFKAKLFPGKQLPKKRVNSLKRVETYVNSLNVSIDQLEDRCVTPVFEQEEHLNADDFLRKRDEFLRQSHSDAMHGVDEIVVLDIPESQDDHLEAAMERRQALLRYREEKKNSLKLEGIQEESPQTSPKHKITLPTPEEYEDYLDAEVEQDYPELASTPCLTPSEEQGLPTERDEEEESLQRTACSENCNCNDECASEGMNGFSTCSRYFDYPSLCNIRNSAVSASAKARSRSLSDSHDCCSSGNYHGTRTLKSMRSVHSCESHTDNQYSNSSSARESITTCSMSSTSGYSSMSFDSSSTQNTQKKATLFLPAITTSLPEISLQPPTPQAPKPKLNKDSDERINSLKYPGYRSKFLTVPGSEDDVARYLPGNPDEYVDDSSSSNSNASDEEETCLQKSHNLSVFSLRSSGLRKFDSSCDMSTVGLTLGPPGAVEERAQPCLEPGSSDSDEEYDVVEELPMGRWQTAAVDVPAAEQMVSYAQKLDASNRNKENEPWLDASLQIKTCNFNETNAVKFTIDNINANFTEEKYSDLKMGSSVIGSFVADKLAIFEKVAEDEHQRYVECQAARKRIQKVPSKTGEYIEKLYGPCRVKDITGRVTNTSDYMSDSEGYESNCDDLSSKFTTSPPSSGRRTPGIQNSAPDKGNCNSSADDASQGNIAYSCHYQVKGRTDDCQYSHSTIGKEEKTKQCSGDSTYVHFPVPRLMLISSVDERLPSADDDSFSLHYNDEDINFDEVKYS